jgi:hypothetical protein
METKPHSGHSDMVGPFLDAVKARRTYYSLTNESTIPDSEIISIAKEVIKHTPSSLNSQSTRFVIVLGDQHRRLWDIAKDCVKAIDSAEDWSYDEKNMSNRQAAYGTVRTTPSRKHPFEDICPELTVFFYFFLVLPGAPLRRPRGHSRITTELSSV